MTIDKNTTLSFACSMYIHIINTEGDWDGYETEWTINAANIEQAEDILTERCNMHTEPGSFYKFYTPIDEEWYDIEKYPSTIEAINREVVKQKKLESQTIAMKTSRETFLDREMPYFARGFSH